MIIAKLTYMLQIGGGDGVGRSLKLIHVSFYSVIRRGFFSLAKLFQIYINPTCVVQL